MATVVREQTVPHVFVGRCRLSKAEVKAQGNNGVVAGVHLDNEKRVNKHRTWAVEGCSMQICVSADGCSKWDLLQHAYENQVRFGD